MLRQVSTVAMAVVFLIAPLAYADETQVPEIKSAFTNLTGRVVLENDRVLVRKYAIEPGESTGPQMHETDGVLVFVKGGVLTSDETHRATLWKDGRVIWQSMADRPTAGSTNMGSTSIQVILVSLKPSCAATRSDTNNVSGYYLNYPNIPGEDILENDSVVVQRFLLNPGQWEGVHAHRGNMLWIFIKGGMWSSRTKNTSPTAPQFGADGTVGWMPAIDISQGHESGNVGTTPRDVVWITLKH